MGTAIVSFLCVCILKSLHVSTIWHAALMTVSGQSGPKQDSQFVKPGTIQGCYDLALSPWRPDMKLGEDEEFITPAPRVQLFAKRGTEGWESKGYVVRPAPGIKPSIHRGAYWLPTGPKSIEIVWTTGFSGLSMELKTSDAEVLRSEASTFGDFGRRNKVQMLSRIGWNARNRRLSCPSILARANRRAANHSPGLGVAG